jgi:rubrerythrin
MRKFDSLSEREILALAISLEEDDERTYADYAEGLRENFAASAAMFDAMGAEESGHRRRLIELYRQAVWGSHSIDPAARCERVRHATAGLADAAAWARDRAQAGCHHGN